MRVLLIDDHAMFREGVRQIFATLRADIELIEAASCEAALDELAIGEDLDIILLDLDLPTTNGINGITSLQKRWPTAPVIILSGSGNIWEIGQAIRRGALGFVPKTMSGAEIIAAIDTVMAGNLFVPAALWQPLQRFLEDDEPKKLTDRQRQIVVHMAQGLSNKAIARELNITDNTVKVHVAAIFRALQVDSRTEAAHAARLQGLIE